MNNRRKEKKKKEREKIAKKRVLYRRNMIRTMRKEEEAKNKLEKELSPKTMPILNDPLLQEEREKSRASRAQEQIAKNLELLQALEEEYDKEQELRKQVNDDLESEGHMSMKDKLDALHKKAIAMQAEQPEEVKSEEETPVDA